MVEDGWKMVEAGVGWWKDSPQGGIPVVFTDMRVISFLLIQFFLLPLPLSLFLIQLIRLGF
jgi:hypothetical protein